MNRSTFFYFILFLLVFGCDDKVKEFGGFTQKELEFLLSSDFSLEETEKRS